MKMLVLSQENWKRYRERYRYRFRKSFSEGERYYENEKSSSIDTFRPYGHRFVNGLRKQKQ